MRVLTRSDVRMLLDMTSCIDEVENAFRLHASGKTLGPGVLGTPASGGGFHVKAAGLVGVRSFYAAKINANFPGNPVTNGLPTIQGIVALYDATTGSPLAIMDSMEITSLRTAAASAVAAKYLSRADARVMTIIGCGVQARDHARAMTTVRQLDRIYAFDTDGARATAFARETELALGTTITPIADYRRAVVDSDIVVTCTPAHRPLLFRGELRDGVFVAAVGADSEDKQELDAALLAECVVVVDVLEQCATIGELHHALEAGLMTRDDVATDLAGLVSGAHPGRTSPGERVVFDSTGTALQDVAAAVVAYERACESGAGTELLLTH